MEVRGTDGLQNGIYRFSEKGFVKAMVFYPQQFLFIVGLAVFIPLTYVVFVYWHPDSIVELFVAYPIALIVIGVVYNKVGGKRTAILNSLPFDELKAQKHARVVNWSDVTKAKLTGNQLDIWYNYGGLLRNNVVTITSSVDDAKTLLRSELGSKIEQA